MCGDNVINGMLAKGYEYDHVVNQEKLILPSQWYGVEKGSDIGESNEILNDGLHGTWITNDFLQAMTDARSGTFIPAIVNADMTSQPETGVPYMADIMHLLSWVDNEVVLFVNFCMDHFYRRLPPAKGDDVIQMLLDNSSYQVASKHARWEFPCWDGTGDKLAYYQYGGTRGRGRRPSSTTMAIFVAVKLSS
jgi:hypothetical protein